MDARLVDLWNHHPWLRLILIALAALLVAAVLHRLVRALLLRIGRGHALATDMLTQARAPMRWLVPLIVLAATLRALPEARVLGVRSLAEHVLLVLIIGAATWLGVRCIGAVENSFTRRFPVDAADNLRARRVLTQARVLGRCATVVLILIGLAAALMTIPGVRQIGASLLASAGLAGLAVGLAARPVLSNLIAGLQIAITQPIRLDDVVIIEGEWGRIDEITATYVVVRIWDQRRLVVPLNWFMENPFQNWTRKSAELIGSVFLWLDYGVPLAALREELKRLCAEAAEWDKRVCVLQVTDTNERAMQVRALVSSADSGRNWDLRCRVREGLLCFVQENYPGALPRLRGELSEPGQPATRPAARTPMRTPPPEQRSPTAEDGGPREAARPPGPG